MEEAGGGKPIIRFRFVANWGGGAAPPPQPVILSARIKNYFADRLV